MAIALAACADEDLRDAVALELSRSLTPEESGPPFGAGTNASADAVLLDWPNGERRAQLLAISGGSTHSLGIEDWDVFDASLSPSGRYAALAARDPASQMPSALVVVRLDSGRVEGSLETPSPHAVAWSTAGEQLYLVEDRCAAYGNEGACESGWRHVLRTWDLETNRTGVLHDVPFWTHGLSVSPDGTSLYALGWRTELCCGIDVEGTPFLAAIDLASGLVRAEVSLPDLLLGQRIEELRHGEFGVWRQPALALAPDGSKAYIAHAEDEGITVVDLERLKVIRTSTPRFASGLLDRLGGWVASMGASRAEAKGGLYFAPQIIVSPDGSRLYVSGVGSETCAGQPYFACVEGVPMGLRIIDADSLELLLEIDGISRIALSPDGAVLAGTAVVADGRGVEEGAPYHQLAAGLVLLRVDDLDASPRVIRSGVPYDAVGFGLDGRVYAGAATAPSVGSRCLDGCSLLTVLDADGAVLADRTVHGVSTLVTR